MLAIFLVLVVADVHATGTATSHPSVPSHQQGLCCPVVACPAPGNPDLDRLSLDEKALCDRENWAHRQIGLVRLRRLEDRAGREHLTGRGVVIAHIDTGYTDHPALPHVSASVSAGIDPEKGYNYLEGCPSLADCAARDPRAHRDPYDALTPAVFGFDRQPGHGTGTASTVVALAAHVDGRPSQGTCPVTQKEFQSNRPTSPRDLTGVAPGARLIPMRVADGVILSEGRSAAVVRAVLGAALDQPECVGTADASKRCQQRPLVDIINVSFGRRSPSEDLEAAVQLAERNGIIVVAATGEYPFWSPVRFPAQYPTVIGATGTKVDGTPWSGIFGAGRGPTAFVAAPAFKVWRAKTEVVNNLECYTATMGEGTSFSAPIVASAAALWLERWTHATLEEKYGRPAIPAAFRYVLWHHGFRNQEDLCQLAHEEQWPNTGSEYQKTGVCGHRHDHWGKNWGRGILAVDRLIEFGPLPEPEDVCQWVYERNGENAWDRACPPGSPGRRNVSLTKPAAPAAREKWSRVAGASFGNPWGPRASHGPVLDYGLIFSEHYYRAPQGLLVQGQIGAGGNFGAGIGYGYGFGYDPYRDSKQSVSVIPGFGPAVGIGVKAAYMRVKDRDLGRLNLVGVAAHVVVLKVKVGGGIFRSVGRTTGWRFTWEAGFGY